MPTSKRPTRKQAVTKKVAPPKKAAPKKEHAPKTLGELKAKFIADKAAGGDLEALKAQYAKDKATLLKA
tara:strand:- start:1970 stop:2176 length:207 start_codon:yes stop_codon:yes gene_type:complete